jgi:glyoxylase-like metal-dependent hydrolase (beta-lactamase superfamily II)
MVEPEKLWQGSLKVLGYMAEVYGEIIPVPEANISFSEEIGETGIRAFLTPGHAQHHLCFLFADLLFAGEVVGVRSPVKSGIYMRPATPPRFMLDVALDSIDRMIKLSPRYLVIAHYGVVEPALEYLQIGRDQLNLWVEGVKKTGSGEDDKAEERLFAWLLEHDMNYRRIKELAPDIYARERYFLGNTMRGMSGYLESLKSA